MKKISVIISAFLLASGINSQNIYDVHRYTSSDLNGTARYVGMGGAMGALGGDISTMGTNPAGTGIYRSNDFMISFGFNGLHAESDFSGTKMSASKITGSFDNVGFVYATKIGDLTPIRYVNFGFNYTKQKNFNKNYLMGGNFGNASQTYLAALMADESRATPSSLNARDAFQYNYNLGWLPIMAYRANLIVPIDDPNLDSSFDGYNPDANVDGYFESKETGGVERFDFNLSFNVNDKFYIGATLGLYDVNYSKYTYYSETFRVRSEYDGDYMLDNWLDTNGTGVDFKLGIIFRPIGNFRIGAAFHTPTFYSLTDKTNSYLDYQTYTLNGNLEKDVIYPKMSNENRLEASTRYKLVTPWKFNFSTGYTIGQNIALGAEYEFADYSSAKMKYDDGIHMDYVNDDIEYMLKKVHTFKVGVEARLVPQFSVRAGYNHITSAFNKDAYYFIPSNSVKTDTEYNNIKATNNFTLGMGYRSGMWYADVAYQFTTYSSEFSPFQNVWLSPDELSVTKINNDRHQLLMTLGLRF